MKFNKWTLALAAAGVVSFGAVAQAEEAQNQVLTELSSTTLGGYIDTSMIWRPGTGNQRGAGANTGANKQDGFNLNVVQLSLSKPLDPNDNWAAGYQFDLLAGPDAVAYQMAGFGNEELSIQNAYVALRIPVGGTGIDTKIGVFGNEVAGYESFNSYENVNFSRSYGYDLSPLTFTGIMAAYKPTDIVTVKAGLANTADSVVNNRSRYFTPVPTPANPVPTQATAETRKSIFGGVTLSIPESAGFLSDSEFYAGIVYGFGSLPNTTYNNHNQVNYYLGGTFNTPVEGLAVGLCYDYAGKSAGGQGNLGLPVENSYYANALAGYLSYQATEKLRLAGRAEWANCSGDNAVFAATVTADYNLWGPNVITRLEGRWDHNLKGRGVANANNILGIGWDTASNLTGMKNLYTLALNVIYKF